MRIIHDLDEMTETARGWLAGGTVGFVPTMGYLHEGHLALIQAARRECEISVVSIFVNPLLFTSNEELLRYPRDLARDLHLLDSEMVDVVFMPRSGDLYPPDFSTYVTPSGPQVERFEGALRPRFLEGTATLMTKLFQLVRPDVAYFGQKDAQQVAIIRKLVRDFNMDINLSVLPTVREQDGLAMSSWNVTLTQKERQAATVLYRALLHGKGLIEGGESRSEVIEKAMEELVASEPLARLNYAAICDPDTFEARSVATPRVLLVVAANIGNTLLVDNILWLSEEKWFL